MTRTVCRLPTTLLTAVLFLATGIGIPVHGHGDHRGERTHLSADDHGHGTALVVRDMRTERPSPTVELSAASRVAPHPPTAEAAPLRSRRPSSRPKGRSPPRSILPRGPPSHS